jgi:RNA polymerase sigma-70 factor (ECF subfamily)
LPQKNRYGTVSDGGMLEKTGVQALSKGQSEKSGSSSQPSSPERADCTVAAKALLTDQELIDGVRQASQLHFNELYERYFRRIYNFVYGRVRNHADTEEIVQETFTAVFSSIDKYSGKSTLLSWVYGIARNTANNSLRQAKNHSRRLQEIGSEHLRPSKSFASCTPEEQLAIRRYLSQVVVQLEDFGEWQIEIFEMRHLQNLSISEISARTKRSSDSVRSCLYRVKRLLMETAQLESPLTS